MEVACIDAVGSWARRLIHSLLRSAQVGSLFFLAAACLAQDEAPGIGIDTLPPRVHEASGWKSTELVSRDSTSHSYNPAVAAASDGRLYAAWVELAPAAGAVFRLSVARRAPGNVQPWSASAVVAEAALEAGWFDMPCPSLAAGRGGRAHLAWNVDRADGAGGIYYSRLDPQTGVWSPASQVFSGRTRGCPKLVADANDNLHMVWAQSSGVFYRPFDNALNAWLETLRLSEEGETTASDIHWHSTVGTGPDGSMHVAWVAGDGGARSALYYRSRRPGVPWSTVQTVVMAEAAANCSPNTSYRDRPDYFSPTLAVGADGTVHLAWTQSICRRISVNDVAESHIFYRRYAPTSGWSAGEWVSAPLPAGLADRHASEPAIAIVPGVGPSSPLPISRVVAESVHLVWRERTHRWTQGTLDRILYRSLDPASAAWTDVYEVQLFDRPTAPGQGLGPEFSRPGIAVDGSAIRGVSVHTVWAYRTELLGSGPDADVFYRRNLHVESRMGFQTLPGTEPVRPRSSP